MHYLGIDPGLSGGLALIGIPSKHFRMPVIPNPALYLEKTRVKKRGVNIADQRAIEAALRPYKPTIRAAAIELVQMRASDQGLRTAAENVARVKAALERLSISYYIIDAQDWQRHHKLHLRDRSVKIKTASIDKAIELGCKVPTMTRRGKVLHDGIADAWLIACYLRDVCERE